MAKSSILLFCSLIFLTVKLEAIITWFNIQLLKNNKTLFYLHDTHELAEDRQENIKMSSMQLAPILKAFKEAEKEQHQIFHALIEVPILFCKYDIGGERFNILGNTFYGTRKMKLQNTLVENIEIRQRSLAVRHLLSSPMNQFFARYLEWQENKDGGELYNFFVKYSFNCTFDTLTFQDLFNEFDEQIEFALNYENSISNEGVKYDFTDTIKTVRSLYENFKQFLASHQIDLHSKILLLDFEDPIRKTLFEYSRAIDCHLLELYITARVLDLVEYSLVDKIIIMAGAHHLQRVQSILNCFQEKEVKAEKIYYRWEGDKKFPIESTHLSLLGIPFEGLQKQFYPGIFGCNLL